VPRPRVAMRRIRDILRLTFGEGLSRRQVSLSLGVPFTTVADHVNRARAAGLAWPLPEDLDDAGLEALLFPPVLPSNVQRPLPDWTRVHTELRRKGVTLQLLWVEYREANPDGLGYSQFANLYRQWRRHVDVVMRQHHNAGEKLFVDFAGMTIPIYEPTRTTVAFNAQLFVAVLGASSYLFAEALRNQDLESWVNGNVDALESFGGAPEIVVPDNLKSAVTTASRYEPDVNATFQEMARHYQMAVVPARPYKPRDKAKAEAGVQLAERWIIARLRHERFTSLAEANVAIARCVDVINHRSFKKMDGSRAELFERLDRPALRPLPTEPYEFAVWRRQRVNIDYHVELERHYYSVPYQLVGKQLDVRATRSTLEVFFNAKRVASHLRSHLRHGFSTDPAHMPESHRRHAQWTPSRIIAWADKTGPAAAALVDGILARRPHPEQGYRAALGIIRLADRYGQDRCEAACARALAMSSFSYKSVQSILQHNLDRQALPTSTATRPTPMHRNVRGPSYYREEPPCSDDPPPTPSTSFAST
jgi:transposase